MNRAEIQILGSVGASVGGWLLGAPAALPLAVTGVAAGWTLLGSMRPELGIFGRARVRVPGRGIALTIDDGPHPETTPRLLDALDRAGAHATFFFLGDRVERHPHLVARTIAGGHEVGLHGPVHSAAGTWLGLAAGERWLRRGVALLEGAGSGPIRWFRPPFGAVSPRLFASAAAAGLEVVWCSVRTWDGIRIAPATLLSRLVGVGPGDIVLVHDGNGVTADVLPAALSAWAAAGHPVGTIGALT